MTCLVYILIRADSLTSSLAALLLKHRDECGEARWRQRRVMVRLSVLVWLSLALPVVRAQKNYAVAKVLGSAAGSPIDGYVKFEQDAGAPLGDMTVTYKITSLPDDGPKGFHVHQYGDTRNTTHLTTMAAHFVPFMICEDPQDTTCQDDAVHGMPPSPRRQPGDMGNIEVTGGAAEGTLTLGQGKMSLTDSMRSIVGRVVVIHSKQDLGGTIPQP